MALDGGSSGLETISKVIIKAKKLLKYNPTHKINSGIKKTVSWYMRTKK